MHTEFSAYLLRAIISHYICTLLATLQRTVAIDAAALTKKGAWEVAPLPKGWYMIRLSPSAVFEKSTFHANFMNFANFSVFTHYYEWVLFPWAVTYGLHNRLVQCEALHSEQFQLCMQSLSCLLSFYTIPISLIL